MKEVPEMKAQVQVFLDDLQSDEEEFSERFKTRKIRLEYPFFSRGVFGGCLP